MTLESQITKVNTFPLIIGAKKVCVRFLSLSTSVVSRKKAIISGYLEVVGTPC